MSHWLLGCLEETYPAQSRAMSEATVQLEETQSSCSYKVEESEEQRKHPGLQQYDESGAVYRVWPLHPSCETGCSYKPAYRQWFGTPWFKPRIRSTSTDSSGTQLGAGSRDAPQEAYLVSTIDTWVVFWAHGPPGCEMTQASRSCRSKLPMRTRTRCRTAAQRNGHCQEKNKTDTYCAALHGPHGVWILPKQPWAARASRESIHRLASCRGLNVGGSA